MVKFPQITSISGQGIFAGLPQKFEGSPGGYQFISVSQLPEGFIVDALSEDGVIKPFHHQKTKLYGRYNSIRKVCY
ncbi:type 1 glutamine amidotransferase family protein [Lactococcus cremoris]|uniref:hypothetical protein n=1 Tax=Lactococcus lactis subsp. cremoris TaxID=1359 RepID=UPI000B2DBE83|nr:hypothetical protein [Lactococcus cremoris]